MTKTFNLAIALVTLCTTANAQQTVRVLTPSTDTCFAYTHAMEVNDNPVLTAGLGGWALGFFSGVAQGAGKDILRNVEAPDLFRQLYSLCKARPGQPLSVAAEEVARDLLAAAR
jgi:hypothetical protein